METGHIGSSSSSSSSNLIGSKLEEHRMSGSCRQCPSCGHKLDHKPDWVGLPAGVKFDPSDQELIEHLEAKVVKSAAQGSKSHPLIDEFIRTIEGEDGICYTHPEKLPVVAPDEKSHQLNIALQRLEIHRDESVTKDGLSKHFFHRPSKAYTTGTRKRRKIQLAECDQIQRGETRWHKTGKTRPVLVNGKQKGCKKILVLYTNFGKNRKPEKTNWVMHQYHLGDLEEEKEGELVVSKIFYQTQPRQCSNSATAAAAVAVAAASAAVGVDQRRDSGSGSCSSREVIGQRENEISSNSAGPAAYGGCVDMRHQQQQQHLKPDHFSFLPYRKSFEEAGLGETSKMREAREEHEQHIRQPHHHHMLLQEQHHHQQHSVAAPMSMALHINRPADPICTFASPPIQQTTVMLDNPYHVPGILLQTDKFQQQQQQKLDNRSTSGLEELIMGCTSAGTKGEALIQQSQETEWQYSYWSLDNRDHHG